MKKTHKILVNSCHNCPFSSVEFDDFSPGPDTLFKCELAYQLDFNDPIIEVIDLKKSEEFSYEATSPDWCPLREESFKIIYNGNK